MSAAKRGTEYFLLPVKSILNRCDSERVPFGWTVNPYRGCEFGCVYCYARYTHEFMDLDGADFERKIYVKEHAGWLAGRDLAEEDVAGEHIAIGTATDPYQPAEGEFHATRAILERMAQREGLSVSITTKSDRVVGDIDLLQKIAARSTLSTTTPASEARFTVSGTGAATLGGYLGYAFGHYEIRSRDQRSRFAAENRRALLALYQFERHHDAAAPCALARTARPAPRFAIGRRAQASRCRTRGRSPRDASAPRLD